jgi:hypothetical protein
MNLHSVFDELNKLYESLEENIEPEVAVEEEPVVEQLDEATEDEEIEIVEDEPVEAEEEQEEAEVETDAEAQLVLSCSNCGGVIVKSEADVKVDEATDLANAGEACQYCESVDGFNILGVLSPYGEAEAEPEEVEEEAEEIEVEDN